MAGFSVDDDDEISAINVTPLVDVMLVLLIIFMVTTTVIADAEGIGVDKPEAASGQQLERSGNILLVCHQDGTVEMDGKRMTDITAVKAAVMAKATGDPELQGIVHCDPKAEVAKMVELIDILRESGVKKYAIATKQPEAAQG